MCVEWREIAVYFKSSEFNSRTLVTLGSLLLDWAMGSKAGISGGCRSCCGFCINVEALLLNVILVPIIRDGDLVVRRLFERFC